MAEMDERNAYRALMEEVMSKARAAAEEARSGEEFDRGLRMAYYDILSFARDQAEILEIDLGADAEDLEALLR